MSTNRYEPVLSVAWANVTPVEEFESVTAVPGITAPVESVTTPVMEALSCANDNSGIERIMADKESVRIRYRIFLGVSKMEQRRTPNSPNDAHTKDS